MRFRSLVGMGILSSWAIVAVAHAAPRFTVGNVPSYYQGNFGTGSHVNIFYDATYFQFRNRDLRLKLMVPYLSVSGLPQGTRLTGGGVVHRSGTTQTRSNVSGLGDIWLSAHYTVYQRTGLLPAVVPYAKVKLGTASAAKGLGTGRNDYEVGVGLDETIGTRIFPFAHLGYRFVGNPVGGNLHNIWTYDMGSSFIATSRNILTAMFSGSESEQPGYAGPADIVFAWNYNVTRAGSGIQLYADKGLSNGSANYGVGLGAQVVF
ncbi:MAG: hypothetical protein ACYC45_03305 [Acidithiobacillus ferriphilus]|uniref:hypothetical protein n=1 Tax=Acidithiobacillus TaxID=119977 RepID=UPI001C0623A8|nr:MULTISPECIES: hypothetical protein [Acidithiobacillus]MBU2785789.1 hypothetical protein [Acidithiobacillus ferriphilus]MBU2828417.1 hypothetical protein [Acidithiobacillus ferriphilus]MBU2846289.1 hypothetical protein [Acidithiobacillus ferriphilus]MBU2848545.1 hypothetical protein [Acidithiobacillus ferriphilus]MDA8245824.1 hypothetical protein [Acidithiobacillus sp.]